MGVIALITPWNHPLLITSKNLAPALAAGNSIIIKPSEKAPLSIQHLISTLLPRAGLPPGTIQCLVGDAPVAQTLIHNAHVQRIDFTGGTETGRAIAAVTGQRLVPMTAELAEKGCVLGWEGCEVEG